jgi:hypothetical protein
MVDRQFAILGKSVTIPLSTGGEGDFVLTSGVVGLGVPPVAPRFVDSAFDGGLFRGKRYAMRNIDLPILIRGTSRDDMEEKITLLATAVDDVKGVPLLRVRYTPGTDYKIPFVYVSGLELSGAKSSKWHTEVVLSLRCAQPFWEAITTETFEWYSGSSVSVTNNGDVSTPLTWDITGPGTFTFSLTGQSWTLNDVPSGTSIQVRASNNAFTVRDGSGANAYALLGPAPKFFDLPPGTSSIGVSVSGKTSATSVEGSFLERRKALY